MNCKKKLLNSFNEWKKSNVIRIFFFFSQNSTFSTLKNHIFFHMNYQLAAALFILSSCFSCDLFSKPYNKSIYYGSWYSLANDSIETFHHAPQKQKKRVLFIEWISGANIYEFNGYITALSRQEKSERTEEKMS